MSRPVPSWTSGGHETTSSQRTAGSVRHTATCLQVKALSVAPHMHLSSQLASMCTRVRIAPAIALHEHCHCLDDRDARTCQSRFRMLGQRVWNAVIDASHLQVSDIAVVAC